MVPLINSVAYYTEHMQSANFWVQTLFHIQLKLRVGMAHGERIAQGEHIKLVTDRSLPVQLDGGKYGVLQMHVPFPITNKKSIFTYAHTHTSTYVNTHIYAHTFAHTHTHRGMQASTLSDWGYTEEQGNDGEKGAEETCRGPLTRVRETQKLVG